MSPDGQLLLARFFRRDFNPQPDTTWQGDEIIGSKDPANTRMVFHNVNGLPLYGTDGLDMFVNDLATLEVDLCGITEHCLDTTKYHVSHTGQEIVRRHSTIQTLVKLHSSDELAVHNYKPGDTGVFLQGSIIGKLDTSMCETDKPIGKHSVPPTNPCPWQSWSN